AGRVELARLEGLANGAPRLAHVRTVAEAAPSRQLDNVRERLLRAVLNVGELQLAHAGRVEEDPAAADRNQLAPRGGVPPASVAADVADRLQPAAGEPVDQCRLTDS